jgi:uncharacterized protein (DUF2384 family)
MKKAKKNSRPKKKKPVFYSVTDNPSIVNEPIAPYQAIKKLPQQTVYSNSKFETLAAKLPLTLKEWASIIHLSDRTLQRYAKENKPFDGIYADRLLQIEKVITEAAKVFKKPIDFYYWLNEHHTVFNYTFSIASLQTQDGIHMLLDELGRIQQGVYT